MPGLGWPHCWGHHKQRRSMKVDAVLNTFHSTAWYLRMLATCSDQNEDRCGQQQVESMVRQHVPSLGWPHCWGHHKQRHSMKVNELIQARCTYCNCAALHLRMLARCTDQNADRCGQQQFESMARHHVPSLGCPHCWGNHKQRRSMNVNACRPNAIHNTALYLRMLWRPALAKTRIVVGNSKLKAG